MIISVKIAAPFAGWLRSRAHAMAARLARRAKSQGDDPSGAAASRKVVDGYAISAVRTGKICSATVVDLHTVFSFYGDGRGYRGGPRHLYMHTYEPGEEEQEKRALTFDRTKGLRFRNQLSDNFTLEGGSDNLTETVMREVDIIGTLISTKESPGYITSSGVLGYLPLEPQATNLRVVGNGVTEDVKAAARIYHSGHGVANGTNFLIHEEWMRNNLSGHRLLHRGYENYWKWSPPEIEDNYSGDLAYDIEHGDLKGKMFGPFSTYWGDFYTVLARSIYIPQMPRVIAGYYPEGGKVSGVPYPGGRTLVVFTTSNSTAESNASTLDKQSTEYCAAQDCGVQGIAMVLIEHTPRDEMLLLNEFYGANYRVEPIWVHHFRFDNTSSSLLRAEQYIPEWYEYARERDDERYEWNKHSPQLPGGWCQNIVETMDVAFDAENGEATVFFQPLIGRQDLWRGYACLFHQRAMASIKITGLNGDSPSASQPTVLHSDIMCGYWKEYVGHVTPYEFGVLSRFGSGNMSTMTMPVILGAEQLDDGARAVVNTYKLVRTDYPTGGPFYAFGDFSFDDGSGAIYIMPPTSPTYHAYMYADPVSETEIYSTSGKVAGSQPGSLGAVAHNNVTPGRTRGDYSVYFAARKSTTKIGDNKIAIPGRTHYSSSDDDPGWDTGVIAFDAANNTFSYQVVSDETWGLIPVIAAPTCPQWELPDADENTKGIHKYSLILSYPGREAAGDLPAISGRTCMSIDGGESWFDLLENVGDTGGLFYRGPIYGSRYYTQLIGETPSVQP